MTAQTLSRLWPLALASFIGATLLAPAQAEDYKERTIRWGHLLNKDHPLSAGVQKFAELVDKGSGGKIKVREYPNSQLGNELQQQAALQGGTQEMMSGASTTLAGIVKEFGLLDFPFVVSSEQQADQLLDGPVGTKLLERLKEKGLVGLVFWENGFRNVTNSKRAIQTAGDLQGMKIRVMPNPVYIGVFKEFGANPLPLPFGELFTALETRAVDAQENPLAIIASNKFNEVQKYLSVTRHSYNAFVVLVSKKFWDGLSAAERKLIEDAAIEARGHQRSVSRAASQKALVDLKAKGMEINDLSTAERAKLRAASKPATDKIMADYDPALVREFMLEVERVNAVR
jgi:TRAP-type transport system periplasmic protein